MSNANNSKKSIKVREFCDQSWTEEGAPSKSSNSIHRLGSIFIDAKDNAEAINYNSAKLSCVEKIHFVGSLLGIYIGFNIYFKFNLFCCGLRSVNMHLLPSQNLDICTLNFPSPKRCDK